MSVSDLLGICLFDAFWSGIAALGFAVLFNVPRRFLIGCVLSGALGHTFRTLLTHLGVSLELATLIGAAVVGVVSMRLSDVYRVPISLFTVTGAIPLVPGVFAYQTMVGLLNAISASGDSADLLTAATINGVRTAVILGAIAFGIAAPTLLFRRPRPIV